MPYIDGDGQFTLTSGEHDAMFAALAGDGDGDFCFCGSDRDLYDAYQQMLDRQDKEVER